MQQAKLKGLSIRGIARELGIHRDTVRKYINAETPPTQRSPTASTASPSDTIPEQTGDISAEHLARLNLLIIDEPGFVPLSQAEAELLFEVFSQRYERGSIMVPTNPTFDEWTEVFASERLTGARLDRLTHHMHILEVNSAATVSTSAQAQPGKRRLASSSVTGRHLAHTGTPSRLLSIGSSTCQRLR